jgi:phosphatidylglycerophosphate synthase
MISLPTRPLFIAASSQLMIVAGALAATTMLFELVPALSWRGLSMAFVTYGLVATFVVLDLGHHAPHQRFGVGNSVTLTRAALTALLWSVVGETLLGGSRCFDAELRWFLAIVATAALLLDGIDGWMARRSGMVSDFGAHFDMEVDSLFVLALSVLAYGTGDVGAWVLAIGLMRYIFVFAGWLWPVLAAPLMPLLRRKVISVLQAAVLIATLAPMLPIEAAQVLCLISLALLMYSFGADMLWLTTRTR